MGNEDKNIISLIALIDDPDEEIFTAVRQKLVSLGVTYLPELEKALSSAETLLQHERLDNIIIEIKNNTLGDRIVQWANAEKRSLIDGWILVSSIQHPDISSERINRLIQQLVNDVWLELNDTLTSLEMTSVINHIFFDLHHYEINISDLAAPENCFIDSLLISKNGNHISLMLLYYILGKQLQLPIIPVSFKQNLLLGYYDPTVALEAFGKDADPYLFYINPEHKGAIIGTRELEYIMQKESKELRNSRVIEDDLSLIKKLLYFVKRTYQTRGQHDKANLAEQLLVKLQKV